MTYVDPSERDDIDTVKAKLGLGGTLYKQDKLQSHSSTKLNKSHRKNS
jgi:hypothetical protein